MRFEPGYGLSETQGTQVKALLFMLQEDDPGASLPWWALSDEIGKGVAHHVFPDVDSLRAAGFVRFAATVEERKEPIAIALTASGRDLAQQIKSQVDSPSVRRKACRNAYLRWVDYARDLPQGTPHSVSITGTPYATFYGSPFTDQELADASRWLKENAFVTGHGNWQAGVSRAELTHKGETYVDRELDVNQPEQSGTGHHLTVNGNGNAISVNSPRSVQSTSVTITDDHRKQLLQLADSIQQASESLLGDDVDVPDQLRQAAGQDDPSVVTRALARMQSVLLDAGSSALGGLILGTASGLLTHYGIPIVPS